MEIMSKEKEKGEVEEMLSDFKEVLAPVKSFVSEKTEFSNNPIDLNDINLRSISKDDLFR